MYSSSYEDVLPNQEKKKNEKIMQLKLIEMTKKKYTLRYPTFIA